MDHQTILIIQVRQSHRRGTRLEVEDLGQLIVHVLPTAEFSKIADEGYRRQEILGI